MQTELVQKLEVAFADVKYPGDDYIGDLSLKDFIGQKLWKQVPIEMLFQHETGIHLFTPEAFHFYLPAFIRVLLLFSEAERMLDIVISSLTPSSSPYMRSLVENAIGLFSDLEKAVVLEFLQRHQELFPKSEFVLFDEDKAMLQRAIEFWENN